MSFNKIILVGNLGRDPELRYTPQGTPVCQFNVATNEKRKNREGAQENTTTWFQVTLWGRQAEVASQYLVKGKQVFIEGRLHLEEWTDREGLKRTTLKVNASDVHFLSSGGSDEHGASEVRRENPLDDKLQSGADLEEDDIPF